MATASDSAFDTSAPRGAGKGAAAFIDKWIYVFMAGLFVVTALVGFVPTSIGKVMAVSAGARAPFPLILHVHAALMGSWLLLLLAQSVLMATGRRDYHFQLGVVGMIVAPAMILAGLILVPTMVGGIFGALQDPTLPPPARQELQGLSVFVVNILLAQLRTAIAFSLFVGWALVVRRTDPETHKRLLILGTAAPLGAAIDRMFWLPTTMPASPVSLDLFLVLWVAPMFLWDVYRRKRIRKAYVIWFAATVPLTAFVLLAWNTSWWQATGRSLLGVS